MWIGFFTLVAMAIIVATSKNVNVRRIIGILGFVVCWLGCENMMFVFILFSIFWIILLGGTIMGIQQSKATAYLANKYDESKKQ